MWARLDDELLDHEKVSIAGREIDRKNGRAIAIGFFSMALMWANKHLSDGVLPIAVIEAWGSYVDKPLAVAEALATAGLLDEHAKGYRIHDFTDYNPTAAQIKKRRKDRHIERGNGRG